MTRSRHESPGQCVYCGARPGTTHVTDCPGWAEDAGRNTTEETGVIVLVSGATKTLRKYQSHPNFGHLKTPRGGHRLDPILASGCKWACDNDAFSDWNEERFRRMLGLLATTDKTNLLWVACPDVVGNAKATAERFELWEPGIRGLGLPIAFVGQDGAEDLDLPWKRMDALFVGGSTEWKESRSAMGLCDEAKSLGKFVHVGRVNTIRRLEKIFDWGNVDTIDGTCFSRWPDKFFPWFIRNIQRLEQQPVLWEAGR